jgi:26S proteasome regulatory subunit T1
VLKTYGAAPYGAELKKLEKEIKDKQQTINEKIGVKVGTTHAFPKHVPTCTYSSR